MPDSDNHRTVEDVAERTLRGESEFPRHVYDRLIERGMLRIDAIGPYSAMVLTNKGEEQLREWNDKDPRKGEPGDRTLEWCERASPDWNPEEIECLWTCLYLDMLRAKEAPSDGFHRHFPTAHIPANGG